VAGLRAAIELAPHGRVLVVAKDSLHESNSEYAQGGIAAALADDDEVVLHEADTLAAGAGLCRAESVRVLVEEGPGQVLRLIEWGAEFDREGGKLVFARGGAHSRSRVLHAQGDSTGREIARTLYLCASALPAIEFRSFAGVLDLLRAGDAIVGAVALDEKAGALVAIRAKAVLVATGGMGCVFTDTTNPDVATGDGVAAAWRAGAAIDDIEFVQFHPTALHVAGAPRFLLSEALRGEGARLLNAHGERFMARYHALGELAPRDVVARAMVAEMQREGSPHVFLDLSHRGPGFVRGRFPRVYQTCLKFGIDLDREAAPVHPAAHYAMGGVATDLDGRTTLAGLYAAGEAACTGVHGANRLASNSLLEGLVYGTRAAHAMMADRLAAGGSAETVEPLAVPLCESAELRRLASEDCGITRSEPGLRAALDHLDAVVWRPAEILTRAEAERRNRHRVTTLIARAALARRESRGAHQRIEFPAPEPAFAAHSRQSQTAAGVEFVP
jgi:L-aspartate oxidase